MARARGAAALPHLGERIHPAGRTSLGAHRGRGEPVGPRGELHAPRGCSGTETQGAPPLRPSPEGSAARGPGGCRCLPDPLAAGTRRCDPRRLLGQQVSALRPDDPPGPALTRHRPSTNTRGSRWQAMVALGRSCRSTSSISQSMKLQSPPPSSASAGPERGAKGRSVTPGRARASAASAAAPSRGPATPSSIPAPARPYAPQRAAPGSRAGASRVPVCARLAAPRLTPSGSRGGRRRAVTRLPATRPPSAGPARHRSAWEGQKPGAAPARPPSP